MKDEVRAKLHRHRHNALLGSASRTRRFLETVCDSPSTTAQAKHMAAKLIPGLAELAAELYLRRVELDGTVVYPRHEGTKKLYP